MKKILTAAILSLGMLFSTPAYATAADECKNTDQQAKLAIEAGVHIGLRIKQVTLRGKAAIQAVVDIFKAMDNPNVPDVEMDRIDFLVAEDRVVVLVSYNDCVKLVGRISVSTYEQVFGKSAVNG